MTKICIFPKCERKCNCKDGYCQAHKEQLSKGQELKPIRKPKLICMFPGCKRRHYRHGLCACHDRQKNKGQELSYIKPNSKYGSGHINVLGYKIISINGKERLEHRVIMENHIRRSLLRSESVHHINGDKLDNRIENLELWATFQPTGQRVKDQIKLAIEILEMYKDIANSLLNCQNVITPYSVSEIE